MLLQQKKMNTDTVHVSTIPVCYKSPVFSINDDFNENSLYMHKIHKLLVHCTSDQEAT